MQVSDWIRDISNDSWLVYLKRLSGNDTGATKSHQVGVYFPKNVLTAIFPSIGRVDVKNPERIFKAVVDSDGVGEHELRAVYYNGKKFGDGTTRDEKRITRWKEGVVYTPFQDPEKTGSIAIFAFNNDAAGDSEFMRSWVCRDLSEEEIVEELVGEVEPQTAIFERGDILFGGVLSYEKASTEKYPSEWKEKFPSGAEIINYLFDNKFHVGLNPDERVIKRREHEFSLFKLVESHHVLPLITNGFTDVEEFIRQANSISNRRKSRSGKSLEIHLEKIFVEEGLNSYGTQCVTESNKKPDFLFPSCESYHEEGFSKEMLRMLAVKTTVKDRWRQILNEANKIDTKYLFTLQKGVSENQFKEMSGESVKLVVPRPIHTSFPKMVRPHLLSLSDFIEVTKSIYR